MIVSKSQVQERLLVLQNSGRDETADPLVELTKKQRLQNALADRDGDELPDGQLDNDEGMLCLLDFHRVFNVEEYVRVKYGISWAYYRDMFDLPPDVSRFSSGYLQRFHDNYQAQRGSQFEFAVKAGESILHTDLVCMLDGETRPMLQRYVRMKFGLTWEGYLVRCGLPDDYPATAPYCADKMQRNRGLAA
jgi:predicted transcriptional regulator